MGCPSYGQAGQGALLTISHPPEWCLASGGEASLPHHPLLPERALLSCLCPLVLAALSARGALSSANPCPCCTTCFLAAFSQVGAPLLSSWSSPRCLRSTAVSCPCPLCSVSPPHTHPVSRKYKDSWVPQDPRVNSRNKGRRREQGRGRCLLSIPPSLGAGPNSLPAARHPLGQSHRAAQHFQRSPR